MYEILDSFEAGIALHGPEVKSLRAGRANLADSYAHVRRGEIFLVNAHISPYEEAGRENKDPRRERKLLLHRSEIGRLSGELAQRGLTLIPLSLYFKDGRVKVAVSLAKGKKEFDKRETLKQREVDRETRAAIKSRR